MTDLSSRKFRILLYDALVSLILFFIGKYVPDIMEDVKFVIGALQPVVIIAIGGIAAEDFASKISGNDNG